MYTFNFFVYGHDIKNSPELNDELHDCDLEFTEQINGFKFEVDFPYHGGQVAGDVCSTIFGTVIADDDGNSNYTNEVRNAKEEKYKENYILFLEKFKEHMTKNLGVDSGYDEVVNNLIEYLENTQPGFYSVEASS